MRALLDRLRDLARRGRVDPDAATGTVPLRMLCMAGPEPGYGMCVTLMPAAIFSSSPARCGVVPTPALA